jgi:E3 ubiquitin-protein ligase DOA10
MVAKIRRFFTLPEKYMKQIYSKLGTSSKPLNAVVKHIFFLWAPSKRVLSFSQNGENL